jgi:hypothetical protein
MLFWALLASGQINMRPHEQPLDILEKATPKRSSALLGLLVYGYTTGCF